MHQALPSSPSPSTSQGSHSAFELLCASCAAKPGVEQMAQIAGWQYADFDWREFIRSAEHHGVIALVAHNLLEHASALPPEIRRSFESVHAETFRRNLWFAAELMRITRHLAANGLRAIPYKGPVLAQAAYHDLALRSFSDIDLLIPPADFAKARQALAEIGYQPSAPLTGAIERFSLRTGYERSFDGPGGKNLLELQWAVIPRFYAVDPELSRFDDLWARAGRINLGAADATSQSAEAAVPCLSPEDSLLIVCLHAAKHLWTRMIWVADIAETSRVTNLDFPLAVSRARALGITRILGVSFWLAKHLLGTILPPPAQTVVEGDPEISSIGEACVARLAACSAYNFESTSYFRQILRLRERPKDGWRYLWRLAWTPGQGDIDAIALPEILFPLYRGVRGARLLARLVKFSLAK